LHLIKFIEAFQIPKTGELFFKDYTMPFFGEKLITDLGKDFGKKFCLLSITQSLNCSVDLFWFLKFHDQPPILFKVDIELCLVHLLYEHVPCQ
jgi:hypothetical protein